MITPMQAADAINYLFAAQALTAVDNMDAVWADYINAEVPDLNAADLAPATRLCLKNWAHSGRSWKVDLPRFVEAIQQVRKDRLRAETRTNGPLQAPVALEPADDVAWKKAAAAAILQGATREQAETHAWEAIGQTPPAIESTQKRSINTERIGK